MEKVTTLKAEHDRLYADLTSYLDTPDADFSVAEDKENAFKSVKADLEKAIALSNRISGYGEEIKARTNTPANQPFRMDLGSDGLRQEVKAVNPGHEFVGSDFFKSFRKGNRIQGGVSLKATLTRSGLSRAENIPGFAELGRFPLGFADLFSQSPTSGDSVKFVRASSFTNYASGVSEGAAKPAATSPLTVITAPVEKIAVVEKVTEETLADYAETESFLNSQLSYMVLAKRDQYTASGSGTSPELMGLLNTTGVQPITRDSANSESAVDAIFRGIMAVLTAGFTPDNIVVNPTDWQKVRIAKGTGDGQYLLGSPGIAISNVLWGLPVTLSANVPAGTAVVGAFKIGGTYYTREGLRVEVTNSNEDDFIKNLLAMRVELRGALAIRQPTAFAKVTGL